MRREYWKLRFVPEKCPECGKGQAKEPKTDSVNDLFIWAFEYQFNSWRIKLEKHPFWRVPCWIGDCGNCRLIEAATKPNYLLQKIKERTSTPSIWRGAVTPIRY